MNPPREEPAVNSLPDTRPTEAVIAADATRAAGRVLHRAARRVGRVARRIERHTTAAADLRARAAALRADPLRAPHGGTATPEQLGLSHDRLDGRVARSLWDGHLHHRRVGRAHRIAARLIPWIDALLFAYFVAGVSNANLAAPWTTPVASLVALAFTAFLVLTVAVFTPWLGHALRAFKGGDGRLRVRRVGAWRLALVGLWAVLTTAIGATMVVRVRAEAVGAGAEPVVGITVAVLLGLASVAMSCYVLAVAFADGSPVTDDLRACAAALDSRARRVARLERRAARRDLRAERLRRVARRIRLRAEARGTYLLTDVEPLVADLRIRADADPTGPLPAVVEPDRRALVAAVDDVGAAPSG